MDYLDGIVRLAAYSPLFENRNVRVRLISNPAAGGYTRKKYARRNMLHLENALASLSGKRELARTSSGIERKTEAANHARELARAVIEEAKASLDPDDLYLLVTAGGDGTSLEVQSELAREILDNGNAELASHLRLLRLPFGTGNDGSDGRTLDQTLSLLAGSSRFSLQPAVRVYSQSRIDRKWYAFNIASVGIDAFITHMTNKLKKVFPGNFYKLWVDIACVFYDLAYRVAAMDVVAFDRSGTEVINHNERMLLYVMGATGNRTYGANQNILPDTRNVCGIRNMGLLRRLSLKGLFKKGFHVSEPEACLYSADRMIIKYPGKILVQLDGEAHTLTAEDFPLVMERTEPFIPIIVRQ